MITANNAGGKETSAANMKFVALKLIESEAGRYDLFSVLTTGLRAHAQNLDK